MSKESRHVVPNATDGWSVKKSNASRASRVFDTQKDAIGFARQQAKKERTELYIHRKDGTIRQKDSYGNDPFPPRDKK